MPVIAIASVPKDGGTYSFYRNLRSGLEKSGYEVVCVTVGYQESKLVDADFLDDGCIRIASTEKNLKNQAMAFVAWCIEKKVNLVFGLNSIAVLSALPHLPENIRVVSRCANAFVHGYKITMSCYQRLYRIVALAPVQVKELVNTYGADRKVVQLIPNGTNVDRFASAASEPRGKNQELSLGFLGRLEHRQKGVLFIPGILAGLEENHVPFKLRIAGKGVHGKALENALRSYVDQGKVEFLGMLQPDQVPDFLAEVDVFLFPSQFEGSPNALIEALMAGCVPAAWSIEGLIDFVVDDGGTGVLAPLGKVDELADRITELHKNRVMLERLSREAVSQAKSRFSVDRMVNDYATLIDSTLSAPLIPWKPVPWSQFRVDPAFAQPFWRKYAPGWSKPVYRWIKNVIGIV